MEGDKKKERQPDGKKEGKGKEERRKRERLKVDIKQIRWIQVEGNINKGAYNKKRGKNSVCNRNYKTANRLQKFREIIKKSYV